MRTLKLAASRAHLFAAGLSPLPAAAAAADRVLGSAECADRADRAADIQGQVNLGHFSWASIGGGNRWSIRCGSVTSIH
jgi:hypothetical protein